MSPPGATEAAQRTRTSRPPEKPRHSGIGLHTPASVHYGSAKAIQHQRSVVLDAAYAAHPERFFNKAPQPPKLPDVAWINKPREDEEAAKSL